MKGLPANSWVRILAGAAVALLAGELFFPAPAKAGCGDYVTVGSEHSMPNNQQPRKPEQRPGRQEEPAKTPCHGPRCGHDQAPDPAPPTTSPVRLQDFAFLVQGPRMTQSEPIPFWAGQANLARVHRTFLIYHPPRP